MMQMLSPDLLDRRALALIELVDYAGRPMVAPAQLAGDGMRFFAKGGGRYALLEAAGFEAHTASFATQPATPIKTFSLDIGLADPIQMSRRAEVKLPRSADPADRDKPDSLFQPLRIMIHPTTGAPIPATAAGVRVSVVHKTNKKLVGNALVRVKSANGKFAGTGFTDVSGEALVIIPYFPISFTTGGATVEDSLAATVTVVADPTSAELTDPADLSAKMLQSGMPATLVNPDKIAAQFAAPAGGTAIRLSTRKLETIKVEWSPP
jgi:hypothetical protein